MREASRAHGVAVGTMLRVYEALETQGLIEARPRSGYFFCRQAGATCADPFYATLQAIERLRLRAIEIPTNARTSLDALATVLRRTRIATCIAMSNYQNPLGSLMPDTDKQTLVQLLQRHEVPLIEDDVYLELHHGETRPRLLCQESRARLFVWAGRRPVAFASACSS